VDGRLYFVLGFSPSLKIEDVAKAQTKGNPDPPAEAGGNSCPSLLEFKTFQQYGLKFN
jgi:hypothetical protein